MLKEFLTKKIGLQVDTSLSTDNYLRETGMVSGKGGILLQFEKNS